MSAVAAIAAMPSAPSNSYRTADPILLATATRNSMGTAPGTSMTTRTAYEFSILSAGSMPPIACHSRGEAGVMLRHRAAVCFCIASLSAIAAIA